MSLKEAERAVVIARRRKRNAPAGRKQIADVRLKDAVTAALKAATARSAP